MRTATAIYEEYRIPSWLQMHQLRVAAVGKMCADRIAGVDVDIVVRADLFHDMGNILKTDLSPGGPLLALVPENELDYWRSVKEDFRSRYGNDEHVAAIAIAREIGLPESIQSMIDNMRFTRTDYVFKEGSMEMKIAKYADLRVSPFGIPSMRERFEESNKRYATRSFDTGETYAVAERERIDAVCIELERYVCNAAGIDPVEITDETAAPVIEELKKYTIS